MGKNGYKKKTKSTNERDFAKKGVYCNDLMLKAVFIVMILKIKQNEKDPFGDFRLIKVRYVPWPRRFTQYSFRAKPTVHLRLFSFSSFLADVLFFVLFFW